MAHAIYPNPGRCYTVPTLLEAVELVAGREIWLEGKLIIDSRRAVVVPITDFGSLGNGVQIPVAVPGIEERAMYRLGAAIDSPYSFIRKLVMNVRCERNSTYEEGVVITWIGEVSELEDEYQHLGIMTTRLDQRRQQFHDYVRVDEILEDPTPPFGERVRALGTVVTQADSSRLYGQISPNQEGARHILVPGRAAFDKGKCMPCDEQDEWPTVRFKACVTGLLGSSKDPTQLELLSVSEIVLEDVYRHAHYVFRLAENENQEKRKAQ